MSVLAMGWRDVFTSRKAKQVDAVVAAVRQAGIEQEAATSRLERTIQGVIDAKTGQRRNESSSNRLGRT